MIDLNAMLLCDTYKTCHEKMYPNDLTKLVSYWTPRKSMFENEENKNMVFFGLQAFMKEFLISYFNRNFFEKPIGEILESYRKYMNIQIGPDNYNVNHIEKLHELGYLPIQIMALPEGTVVNMGIPCIEVCNTVDGYAWLVQWIECIMQAELWKICNHATIGHQYYKLSKYFYDKTTDNGNPHMACSDFGMRGMSCTNEAIKCSAAWLLSFNKTSTVPALAWLDKYYDADCSYNHIGVGAVSTEHSVISSYNAIGINEEEFLKKMLTEIYPNTSFSFLGDTYDYWNFIDNIIPNCKNEILNHNGKLLVRPDSGDQFEIVIKSIQKLWNIFGGTENKKGYKVLNNHIGLILGDGATLKTVKKIWKKLEDMKFSSDVLCFGVGAFPFSCTFEGDHMIVNTRDTYGIAMKSTWGINNNNAINIFKDPKTDSGLKKSHKGCCKINRDEKTGEFICYDNLDFKDTHNNENILKIVFKDGKIIKNYSFTEIRKNLENEYEKYWR